MCRWAAKVTALLFLIGLWGRSGLRAQEPLLDPSKVPTQYVHEAWQNEQGLPQSTVTAIVQTRDGYLWLGTQEGLVRFNGTHFFTFDKRNTPAFAASHDVRALFEDPTGTLWIGTFGGGLFRYDDGTFTAQAEIAGRQISTITADRKGLLWVGTFDDGLYTLHDDTVVHHAVDNGLASNFISTLHVDGSTLWVGTRAGLQRFQGGTLSISETADVHIETVFTDRAGTLWISKQGELVRFEDGAMITEGQPPPFDDAILTFFEDRDGSLWMGTKSSGLARYRAGRFDTFAQEDGLTHNRVTALYQDREGSLWIGTDGGGLNRLRDDKVTPYTEREGLASNMILPLYEDAEGSLWIGSEEDGVSRLRDGVFTHFTTADGLSHNAVYSLAGDAEGTLWIGTYGGGLNRLKDGRFTRYTTNDGLVHDAISVLYDDGAGTLWIGTDGGLSRLKDGRFTNFTNDDGLANPYVLALHQDRHGALWIGTYGGGLQRLQDGVFTAHYTAEASAEQPGESLGSNIVVALYEDLDGTLWIGTFGGGLSRLHQGRLTTYSLKDGLFSDTIYRILEDDRGHLWMSSNKGLFRVRRADLNAFAEGRLDALTPVVYGKKDGLKSQEMNGGFQPAGWKDRAGRLWFPSIKGVAMIDPTHLHTSDAPPVVIEAVIVDRDHLRQIDEVELAPGKKKMEFYFAALSFIDPDRVVYKYKLEGYDEDWSEPTSGHTATYTNLDPGAYTFRVTARNRDGVWNETGASFAFSLRPFFYQTAWFWMLAALGLGLLVFAGHRLHINHLKVRQRHLERAIDEHLEAKVQEQYQQMVAERGAYEQELIAAKERAEATDRVKSAILNNMSHELRTPLTAILGFTEVLSTEVDELLLEFIAYIDHNGRRLLDTLNAILDLAALESRMMVLEHRPTDIVEAVCNAVSVFQPTAHAKGLALRVEAMPEIIAVTDPKALDRVLYQLLSNALKFTNKGEVVVGVAAEAGQVRIQIRDTGIGIHEKFLPMVFEAFKQESEGLSRNHEGSGLGLTLTQCLVQLMDGSIHAESVQGQGSTFSVTFPLTLAASEPPVPSVSDKPAALRKAHSPQRQGYPAESDFRPRKAS